ncbi:MAG: adenylate/guanylate cyclase domain-containing protein [Pseudolabrys sp.]
MAEGRHERRLAAILAADVAGYSRLMGSDEEGTLAALKAIRRDVIDPKIAAHRGRIVKTTGDGILIEFSSVVDALRCAVEVQQAMAKRNAGAPGDGRIEFRVGINLCDIIVDSGDIFGDGVNIAARLEAIAEPEGICISEDAYRQVKGKVDLSFEDIGERQLKNIVGPVRAYRVHLGRATRASAPTLALPNKPSIAVLPFQNMSGDPDQEYFADGMVEEIITALSRMSWLFVIARNSSFTYKDRTVDVKQVGQELGVRYVLEGSVRKSSNRVRVTGQLIDAATATHLWADRFEGGLEDIFDLQDRVTMSVVGAIAPKLQQAEIERAKRKPTGSLDAYDYFLRGMASFYQWTKQDNSEALRHFYKAIELDPDFASAFGMASFCYVLRKVNGWMADHIQETAEGSRLAQRAADLGRDDAVALGSAGQTFAYLAHDLDSAVALIDRALLLNPNLVATWLFSGWVRDWLGEPEVALDHLKHALRLSPLDPLIFRVQGAIALAHFLAGRYDESSSWAEKALQNNSRFLPAMLFAAASNALAGRLAEAKKAMFRASEIDPTMQVCIIKDWTPLRRAGDLARFEDGLRKAGLPE